MLRSNKKVCGRGVEKIQQAAVLLHTYTLRPRPTSSSMCHSIVICSVPTVPTESLFWLFFFSVLYFSPHIAAASAHTSSCIYTSISLNAYGLPRTHWPQTQPPSHLHPLPLLRDWWSGQIDRLSRLHPLPTLPCWCQLPSGLDLEKHEEIPASCWPLWTSRLLGSQLKKVSCFSFKSPVSSVSLLILHKLKNSLLLSRWWQSYRRDRRGAAGRQQDEAQWVYQVFHQTSSTQGPQSHQPGVLRHQVRFTKQRQFYLHFFAKTTLMFSCWVTVFSDVKVTLFFA